MIYDSAWASQVALVVKNPSDNASTCRRCVLNPWVRKIPSRTPWQPTKVLLPEESHGQRSLEGAVNRVAKSGT